MNQRNDTKLTINLPKEEHRKLKVRAAAAGKSMRDVILDLLKDSEACAQSSHIPNKETIKAIKEVKAGKNLVKAKDLNDLFKKLGI